jgi:2-methylcitrate synthase
MSERTEHRPGLRDVIAGETRICRLDEQESQVYIFGYSLEELVERHSYEDVAYLTLFGELPSQGQRVFGPPDEALLRNVWTTLSNEPRRAHPMGLLRTAMSSFGNQVDAAGERQLTYEAERDAALSLTPNVGYMAGQVARQVGGAGWRAPGAGLGYAENILTLFHDRSPDEFEARAMDVALILYTEHEFNAGSFGVRIAASAHSDLYSSVVAGECILRGPRHGCANEEVMKLLLDQGGEPDKVRDYAERFFQHPGARIPGFGHAVYNLPHSYDPRVSILRPWVKELSRRKGDMRWYETLLALEEYMAERMRPRVERGQPNAPANMDLWTAPLYYLLGIPIPMYTPLFAASRVAGWAAHYLETRYVNNEPILRPRAEYMGPKAREFTPSETFGAPVG